jgi:uracil-DNA glycosylase
MTEGINYKNQKYIIHGKALPKNIAYNNASIKYNPEYYSSLFSWLKEQINLINAILKTVLCLGLT